MEKQDNDPLQELLDKSWDHLQNAQKHIEEAFQGYEMTDYDLKEGYVEFAKNKHQRIKVPVYPIGGFSKNHSVWWWAWANSSIPRKQRKKSKKFKELRDTGLEYFAKKNFDADFDLIWQLISICLMVSDDLGVYHLEVTDDDTLFLLIEKS